MRFVALLRGVNVGGVRVPMAELRTLLEGEGFSGVRTVLASGNVLFDAEEAPATLAPRLERLLGESFSYAARALVVPVDELADAARNYPFEGSDDTHSYVVFAEDESVAADLGAAAAQLPEGDRVVARGRLLYWSVAVGSTLDSPFGKLLGKRRSAFTTTRNLRTLAKILTVG